MTIRARLKRLETRHRARSAAQRQWWPGREVAARECQALDRWLETRGLSAQQAVAAGLTGPPELRFMTLAVAAEAERELEALEAEHEREKWDPDRERATREARNEPQGQT